MTINVNELMIGDIVSLFDEDECITPTKIKEIRGETVVASFDSDDIYDELNYEEIMPIPLTLEILEKNGFELQQSWYRRVKTDKEIAVKLPDASSIYSYSNVEYLSLVYNPEDMTEVEYGCSLTFKGTMAVHELQHALRLCGLHELADNLKI